MLLRNSGIVLRVGAMRWLNGARNVLPAACVALAVVSAGCGTTMGDAASTVTLADNTWKVGNETYTSNVPMVWTTLGKDKEELRVVSVDNASGTTASISLIFSSRYPSDGSLIVVSSNWHTFVNGVGVYGTAKLGGFQTGGGNSADLVRIKHSSSSMRLEIDDVRVTVANANNVRLSARLVVPK